MALTTRRLVAIPLLGVALTFAAFGVVRGLISAGPARGVRMAVAIEPPVDDAVRTIAAHVVRTRLGDDVPLRVVPAGDQLVVEVGTSDREISADTVRLLERIATLEVHTVDATNPWLARVVAFAATDPQAAAAGVRVDADSVVAAPEALEAYVAGLAARDPALAIPADRLVAYGPDPGSSWRLYVLGRETVIDGRSIRRAEALDGGVTIDLAPGQVSPGTRLGFLLDGKVKAVAAIDRVASTGIHVQTSGAARELVSIVEAAAAHPLHVRRQEAFERATGFFPRAWPFLAIAGGFLVVVAILWRRR